MAARRAAPQKPPESHRRQPRPSPRSANRDPQQAQPPRLSKCASNDRATHTSRRTRRVRSSPPPASRARPTEGQPATRQRRLHHLRLQQRPYAILRSTGKGPALSRDPSPGGQTERAPREILGRPAGWAQQHSTGRRMCGCVSTSGKYVLHQRRFWHMQRLQGGIVHVSRRVLPNGCF